MAPSEDEATTKLRKPNSLPLGELEALACALLTVLLAFLHPGIASQKAVLAQGRLQFRIELDDGARKTHAHSSRLSAHSAALGGYDDIHLIAKTCELQRLGGVMLPCMIWKVRFHAAAVDGELSCASLQENPGHRFLAAAGAVTFGMVVILLFIITAIFAPLLAPHDPYQQDLSKSLQQPSKEYLLGTDQVGRDLLSRLIYGSRSALMIGLISICIAAFIGMTLGLIAGYFGGWAYMIIMRIIDSFMSFPMLLLALVLAALLGGGLKSVMIAIGISLMSAYARLMCAQVLKVKENDYIMAAKSIGASHLRIMLYHVLRNCFPPLIVLITMNMGFAILIGAGLSFLGLGIEQPGADWGNMVSVGYTFLTMRPVYAIAPGITIMLVVFSFNMVGDGLRDALDPRLRGII